MGFFARVGRLFKGWGLYSVEKAEEASPKALLAAEVDRFNAAQAQFNNNLSQQAGLVARLRGQIATGKTNIAAMEARIKTLLTLPDGEAKAKALSSQLLAAEKTLVENIEQEKQAEALFQTLTKQRDTFVKDAQARIDRVKSKISAAEMAEAQATMAKMASSQVFDPNTGGLSAVEEGLDKRIANAQGAVRVATEAQAQSAWAKTEAEIAADEQNALDEIKRRFQMPST